jgi:hypothetical protein
VTATAGESAADLLAMAEAVMARARPETAGLWPRAAALLARQALEMSLDEFWRSKDLALAGCGTRPQLICLREYMPQSAGRIHEAWSVLSRACHHHPYELSPTAEELSSVLTVVAAVNIECRN